MIKTIPGKLLAGLLLIVPLAITSSTDAAVARAEVDRAIQAALEAKEQLRRQTILFQAGLTSEETHQAFKARFDAAVLQMERAQARLDAAEARSDATAAGSSQVEGRRIVDEAVAALGGERFLSLRDRVEAGRTSFWRRGELSRQSRVKIYAFYPDASGQSAPQERQAFDKDESHAWLFTEGGGYEITFRGARPLGQEQVDRHYEEQLHDALDILQRRLDEPGLIVEYRGSTICENQIADTVDITDSANRVTTVCFSRSTKLPIGQTYFRRDPVSRDRIEEVTLYSRFMDTGDGVLWPRHIQRNRDGEKVFELFLDSVSVNQNLASSLFALPAGLKASTHSSPGAAAAAEVARKEFL